MTELATAPVSSQSTFAPAEEYSQAVVAFLTHYGEIDDLHQAASVLNWDQQTQMPKRGGTSRSYHLSTIAKLIHEQVVSKKTEELLLAAEASKPAAGSDAAAMLRVARRGFEKSRKVPASLVSEMTQTCVLSQEVWDQARKDNDYASFSPWLEKVVTLKRRYVEAVAPGKPIYNTLLDEYEEGMTTDVLDPLFQDLKQQTVPLVNAIAEKVKAHPEKYNTDLLEQDFDPAMQEKFGRKLVMDCGFTFDRGRMDVSTHPFCTHFSRDDVRITTRYERNWLPGSLFGCLHEMGHAFYEMNVSENYERTPISSGVSLGVHESQSRLWENMIGRSKPFWNHYYPLLQGTFPAQLAKASQDRFFAAINHVAPSFIRVEADEITYNLHIILRYEMEQLLLTKAITTKDAPTIWNEKMKASLGIAPPTDREGILQDVHWSSGGMGYFPTYTLGNILAAQLSETVRKVTPTLDAEIEAGRFGSLFNWLKTNVHQHGKKYLPRDLIVQATGKPLTITPYVSYLKHKFSGIFGL